MLALQTATIPIRNPVPYKANSVLIKAVTHPWVAPRVEALIVDLQRYNKVAIFDPDGNIASLAEVYDLSALNIEGIYVQKYEDISRDILGHIARPISQLKDCNVLLVASFTCRHLIQHLQDIIVKGCPIETFECLRLPDTWLSNRTTYLAPENFVTAYTLFHDNEARHTRLMTTNSWSLSHNRSTSIWFCLFNGAGEEMNTWQDTYHHPGQAIIIKSQEIRSKFNLPAFQGQLFMHVLQAGQVKEIPFIKDFYQEKGQGLTRYHPNNKCDTSFNGFTAPAPEEEAIIWIQNTGPNPIRPGTIAIGEVGKSIPVAYEQEIAAYATTSLYCRSLLPTTCWPQQLFITSGEPLLCPSYEIVHSRHGSHMATLIAAGAQQDSAEDLAVLKQDFGKGFILPVPLLPRHRWRSYIHLLGHREATCEQPFILKVYNARGEEVLHRDLDVHHQPYDNVYVLDEILADSEIQEGHFEIMYDLARSCRGPEEINVLVKYENISNDHTVALQAQSQIYNTLLTYKDVFPTQLTTRLFMPLGYFNYEPFCILIYPVSNTWHAHSNTRVVLYDSQGEFLEAVTIQIPLHGSQVLYINELFASMTLRKAGGQGYIKIRDTSCCLVGFHGVLSQHEFNLDYMATF